MKKHLLILIIAIAAFTASAQTQQQADSIYQLGRNVESAKQSRKYAQQALNMYKALHGEVSDDYINASTRYHVPPTESLRALCDACHEIELAEER